MNRCFEFCGKCCDDFVECDNNSWGDCSVYYRCKKSDSMRATFNDWDKLDVPDECTKLKIYKMLSYKELQVLASLKTYNDMADDIEVDIKKLSEDITNKKDYLEKINNSIDGIKSNNPNILNKLDEITNTIQV